MPWQPTRHHRSGSLDIGEMSYAEGDQGQAVERPRDAQTLVAGGKTEALFVPVAGAPDVQNPGGCYHHRSLTGCPSSLHPGIEEDLGHIQSHQPTHEKPDPNTSTAGRL